MGSLTALENVELPMILKVFYQFIIHYLLIIYKTMQGDLSKSEITARAKDLLKMLGLGKRMTHFPNQLSGGE